MSEQVARLAVNYLRKYMFPALPPDVQALFPQVQDQLVAGQNLVPNIVVGEYLDFGANAATPMVTVNCEGPTESLIPEYRHLRLTIDIWIGGNIAPNVDGRRLISIIYEYVNRTIDETNWTGQSQPGGSTIRIQRCHEEERSKIMFDPTAKVYHQSSIYRVEAISNTWY